MIHVYELSNLNAEQRARLLRRAEVAIDELEAVLSKTLDGDYEVEKRMTLEVRVLSKTGRPHKFRVLNDARITAV